MSKRMFALAVAFAMTVTAPFAVAQEKKTDSAKAPRLTLVDPIKDFGTVPKGEKLDWSFEVRNTGTADLEIIAARPACGCTVADFDKMIKPGKTGKITAHVDTTAFAGPISKGVTIETNDPMAPTAQVTISAVVKPYVEAYPAGFVRYNIIQGETAKQSVALYSEEDEPFQIVKIESPAEWIKVEQRPTTTEERLPNLGRQGQNQYRLDITVGGDTARIGPLAEKIRILTNSKHQPEYQISVTGVVRPSIIFEPKGINFGEITAADSGATRTVTLRTSDTKTPEAFVVTKAESGVAGVSAEVKPSADKKGQYEVKLQIASDAKPGALEGSVLIHTTDKINPVITIPIKGTVKPAAASAAPGAK